MRILAALGITILVASALFAQVSQDSGGPKHDPDEQTFQTLENAAAQMEAWRSMYESGILKKAIAGDSDADKLADKLEVREKRFKQWEQLEWVPTQAAKDGNVVMILDGEAGVCCRSKSSNKLYMVYAPLDIRLLILTQKMRWEIGDMLEMMKFDREPTEQNSLIMAWQGAWQDARDVFCKDSPGSRYTDLNGQNRACQQPPRTGLH